MIYLDPKSDIAFKKLFGSAAHKNILMSFLNSVLGRQIGELIIDVVMNDPNNVAETPLSKMSIVDVRCTDQHDNQYIVEMQIVTQKNYAARAQYYSSLALSRQLASGENYEKLVPVIFIGVLDFSLFKTKKYISHHFLLDDETYEHELEHLEFHFIELPKFNKELDARSTILDKWIYFLKNAEKLQQIPVTLKEPVITQAFDILAQSNWSKAELIAYDRYLDSIRSYFSQLETAEAIGEEKGRQEGKLEEKLAIAKELLKLKVLDSATIAHTTGLTIEQIENLKNGYK
ncbi:MAG: Rpn family recombination-promoting nuclease/putative transposase [Candidatus Dependentiae bacterium]|nr:Rpn family recombination-promoting nuclease/putative transposase [Candidatus Dependentiae bacterium]